MVYISDSKYMVFHALTTVPTLLLPQEDYKGVVSSVSLSSKQHNISNSSYSGSFLSTNFDTVFLCFPLSCCAEWAEYSFEIIVSLHANVAPQFLSELNLLLFCYCRIGLVESKIRILISNLENAPFVSLAHVKAQSFPPLEPDK